MLNRLWLVVAMDMEEDSCYSFSWSLDGYETWSTLVGHSISPGHTVDQISGMAGLLLSRVCRYVDEYNLIP